MDCVSMTVHARDELGRVKIGTATFDDGKTWGYRMYRNPDDIAFIIDNYRGKNGVGQSYIRPPKRIEAFQWRLTQEDEE